MSPESVTILSQYQVELNRVPIHWDLEKGTLRFFGIDSALFWTDPSMVNLLTPIVEEIGRDLFRLLVAYSSSLGTQEDYHAMITTLAANFQEGFLAWGKAVSTAGWGAFEVLEYNPSCRQAVVKVRNPWEIGVQRNLPKEKRWGAPFLQGKLIGIFSHAFGVSCWADDTCYHDPENPFAIINIYQSNATIFDELKDLRNERMLEKERELAAVVDLRTAELQHAKDVIYKYSETLERKVEERTADLANLNTKLKKEIDSRKVTEAKLERANQELLELSITDELTGIANRRHFDAVFLSEWNRAIRSGFPLALIIGDVDWFKRYNDTYGHPSGDKCLKLAAQVLKKNARRSGDFVARYGGEEFALVLPMTNAQQAKSIAEKIISDFHDLNLPHSMSEYGHVTMSLGIAVVVPKAGQSMEPFIKAADDALYSAKGDGRNRHCIKNF